MRAYGEDNYTLLKSAATEIRVNKIDIIIRSFREGGQRMLADITRLEYKGASIIGDNAEVLTAENWAYRWVDVKTRAEILPLKTVTYEMKYDLVRKDGKWLVDGVVSLSDTTEKGNRKDW
ncbi:MAG: hypothetical protein OEV59_01455 [Deltaproteobacteria bacterium]|nr:hypothetical protein [Deltaproteobacteria bacterium]